MLVLIFIILTIILLLYIFAISPRFTRRRDMRRYRHTMFAHRGYHCIEKGIPENSMAAFCKAVQAGYGIEMDVQLSKDGVPVVFHDFTLKRICGKEGKVCDYTWKELQSFRLCGSEETIPKFEDVLNEVRGRVPLIVELKVEWADLALCPVVDAMLEKYHGIYCIESFNPLVLRWYRQNHGSVVRGQLSDGFLKSGEFQGPLYFFLQNLMLNFITKPDFIAYNHKYEKTLSRRICRTLFRNLSVAWTIKSREELEKARGKFDIFIFDSFIP